MVDFPDPLPPTNATVSPLFILQSMFSKTLIVGFDGYLKLTSEKNIVNSVARSTPVKHDPKWCRPIAVLVLMF